METTKDSVTSPWWRSKKILLLLIAIPLLLLAAVSIVLLVRGGDKKAGINTQQIPLHEEDTQAPTEPDNPLSNRKLYIDNSRDVVKVAKEYRQKGDTENAELLDRIASQPDAVWLTGPTSDDPTASRDIAAVERTSKEAAKQGAVVVYQLYAIPNRDACAAHSKGGFKNGDEYSAWVDKIIKALANDAVFTLEADAIAHTINSGCLNAQQVAERYAILNRAVLQLTASSRVLGVYLDAGHSDWLPDPSVLVEPLRKSGIDAARGVAVNVSFFADTQTITTWSQQLVGLLGGNKGVIIDTSRNGKGIANAAGEARWCNPPGRGLGPRPTTLVQDANIDAYLWVKTVGESDGTCFGNPPAGVFSPALALELARNASN